MSANPAVIFGPNGYGLILPPNGLKDLSGRVVTQSSGTNASMIALTGTDSQQYWNTTYKALFMWSEDRWIPLKFDKRRGTEFFDEFDGTDRIGMKDWQTNGSSPSSAGNLLNPGIFKLSISAASNLTYLTTQLNSLQLGTMDIYIEAGVSIDQLSDGSNNLAFAFGLNDGTSYSTTSDATDGVYIRYDNATNTNKWIATTASNSTRTHVNSNTAITAATFYRLGIMISTSASARFYVNGTEIVNVGSGITTNLPTGAGRQTGVGFRIDKQLGAGAVTASLDYFWGWAMFNGQRVA